VTHPPPDTGRPPGAAAPVAEGFAERWRWLHPEREPRRERLAGRLWPDLGPAGRALRVRLLLAEAAAASEPPEDPAGLGAARLAERQRMLARAVREQAAAPGPATLLGVIECGLDGAVEPALRLERLARLEELLAPLGAGEAARGTPGEAAEAARRLREGLRHLAEGLARGGSPDTAAGLGRLEQLARAWEQQPREVAGAADPRAEWEERCGEALQPEALLARFAEQIAATAAELERRCTALGTRYLGEPPDQGQSARAFVEEQLAADRPAPEGWERAHRDALAPLAAFVRRRGLLPGGEAPPICRLQPGARPAWPGCAGGELPGRLPLADLTCFPAAGREAWLADWHHAALPLLLAREALPGRLWLRDWLRGQDPLRGWLLHGEDLDGWAGWVVEPLLAAGWMAGEPRTRIVLLRERLRELLLARADLQGLLDLRPPSEIRRALARDGALGEELLAAALQALEDRPGRWAAAALRRLELSLAWRRWRRRHGPAATPAAACDLFAMACTLPLPWIREGLAQVPPGGRVLCELPPAVPPPREGAGSELLQEVEERLAALGRIRREDLDAGAEFDAAPEAHPAAIFDAAPHVQAVPDTEPVAPRHAAPPVQTVPDTEPEAPSNG
jgi:hypothetical protein